MSAKKYKVSQLYDDEDDEYLHNNFFMYLFSEKFSKESAIFFNVKQREKNFFAGYIQHIISIRPGKL